MTSSTIAPEQLALMNRLIELVTPPHYNAADYQKVFKDTLDQNASKLDFSDPTNLLWTLKEALDWDTLYYVDWKDTESTVDNLIELARHWYASINFGVDDPLDEDFLNEIEVPTLLHRAGKDLLSQNLLLWDWDTASDAYAGWISHNKDQAEILEIAKKLGVDIRVAHQQYTE